MDEVALSHNVALRLANTEVDASIALRLGIAVGFQGAVRPDEDHLAGDETAVAKTAVVLISHEARRGHLCVIGNFIHRPIDDLVHSVVTSTVIGIFVTFLDPRPGIRCGLQIQGCRPFPRIPGVTKQ